MIHATFTPSPSQDGDVAAAIAADLVKALNHAIRRSVLRFLLKTSPASSAEIRRGIPRFVGNNINFHLDILVTTGAVARERKRIGHKERFYLPTDAARASWFLLVLKLTAAED